MFSTVLTAQRLPLLLGLLLLMAALPAASQTLDGEPTDLQFQVIDATTVQPCRVERMTIEYVSARRNGILDFEPDGADFVAPAVPLKDGGEYIVTVWYQNVPYWWSRRGHQLKGQTTTLHVFDTTSAVDNVAIKGLNLVVKHQETLLRLEYMLQVENQTKPQQTVVDRVATFELDFPAGASQIEANYRRGPDPTPFAADSHGSRRLSLAVPLTPGLNQIQIKAVVPWQEGLKLPIGSNLAVQSWSILASPEWLDIRAMELEEQDSSVPGFKRLAGPMLEAGRDMSLQLFSGAGNTEPASDLFAHDSTATPAETAATGTDKTKGGGFPMILVFSAFVIIIVAAMAIRRRG